MQKNILSIIFKRSQLEVPISIFIPTHVFCTKYANIKNMNILSKHVTVLKDNSLLKNINICIITSDEINLMESKVLQKQRICSLTKDYNVEIWIY